MRDLADTLGIEASSLYNHIGSKSEILQSICFKVAEDFNMHLIEVEQSPLGSLEKLETLIRFHIKMMLDQYDEVYVANHEWKQLQEPYLDNFLTQRKLYETTLIEIIEHGISKAEIKNLQPFVIVLTILSSVRGLESWHRNKKNVTPENLENDMVIHLLKGLTNS